MKVAYNGCFGGFSLSREAVLLGRKISGDEHWNGACIIGDKYEGGDAVTNDYGQLDDSIERHDSTLVSVIERLGRKAGGLFAALEIKEIPCGSEYEVTYYDGLEDVVPPRRSW